MKNVGTIAAAAFLAVVLLLYMCTFQVRFTEVAIVETFGKPSGSAITDPGLRFKWPNPIQTVTQYDKRVRVLEDRTEETRTADGKNLILTTFTLWKLGSGDDDAIKFRTSFPNEEDGEKVLRSVIKSHKHAVIGKREMTDFISTDADKRKLKEIEAQIRDLVARDARDKYGVAVVDFGIKKLGLPQSVTATIFASMKANEEVKAGKYEAEGQARAQAILAEARATEERIMAAAREKVAEIENEAQRVVSKYYAEFSKYPQLRIFLDQLESAKSALESRTTIILDQVAEPFNVFRKESRDLVRPQVSNDS
ncbi:MAG: SPFH domain-containing protein [Planctomycetota bacterium]|jgi:membrane protease subunit HflC